ncbi:MAG: adenylosuccinate synthetase [Parcubacteria group bacterium]
MQPSEFIERLWYKRGGRRSTIEVGDGWGDSGKGGIEAVLAPLYEASIRVQGGANTGRTRRILGKNGQLHEFIFHLVPTLLADGKMGIIGDAVLVELERLASELRELTSIVGDIKAPLLISKRAPIFLRYHSLIEGWLELSKGGDKVGTTGRGISPMIAGVDLRVGPLTGHLLDPDLLRKWVRGFYEAWLPILQEFERRMRGTKKEFSLADMNPDDEVERLLADAEYVRPFITNIDPVMHDLMRRNVPVLFGMTQGYGLHVRGTYPYNSATQSIAQAAAYCGGLPMHLFGPVILISKLFPTRVGAGPFPTGWWNRDDAEAFPGKRPELFPGLPQYDEEACERFLAGKLQLMNSGQASWQDWAEYYEVYFNNRGSTTKRGREVGGPDLHMTRCAAMVNGADCIAITQVDGLSGLNADLPVATAYELGDEVVEPPTYPMSEELDGVKVRNVHVRVDLQNVDITGIDSEQDLPGCVHQLIRTYERYTGTPVGIISTAAGLDGKIFRSVA